MIYKINVRPRVSRQLKKVSTDVENWVFDVIERLSANPVPANSRVVKHSPFRRIKPDRQIDSLDTKQYKAVQNFRLLYLLREDTIDILIVNIAHRKDVYKRLNQIL